MRVQRQYRKNRRKKRKISERHAAARTVVRTHRSFWSLKEKVKAGRFERLMAQSHTRTLCRADVEGETIYFIINKKRMSIITVLSQAQAQAQLGERNGEGQAFR
jgi:myo-inositol-hexaphosphate 3-phosphohydrolase